MSATSLPLHLLRRRRHLPPHIGARALDFNEEGLAHVGLLPELIEDMRQGGLNDEGLEPLFRSAEGYVRTWERAERRARELRP